jgi:predicted nucleic acid-binding protein
MSAEIYLADTNILIRLTKRNHPAYPTVLAAVDRLKEAGTEFCYTLQNIAEFWNVCTRPVARHGFGLTVEETNDDVREFERSFHLLADTAAVYREWRRVVVEHRISGAQVHDARLAAAMYAHGVKHILTLNDSDFRRFAGLTAVHPSQVRTAS